ncbi:hypothetical protein SAMN05446037_10721 [Anaerovirgula multivorans]|uniref:HEAT repeat-containing protein n=1 Tax=Anaerovirgula multivorans TaxID=312168 RepID=A0A239LBT3_9FIRM|nr:hypothetical protein [Anaerovirgula multivorans]SNT27931.1 hypothetical protein SAMN05446037_10721 [Anaerovirgula multivorans]
MKSSKEDLLKRGFAVQEDIALLSGKPQEELLDLLHSDNAIIRTASAYNLSSTKQNKKIVTDELLKQLSVEKCLYTKLAICESLEKGDIDTAKQMINYLGKIGNNQHKQLPDKVSLKKSFPLPRDIIARSLGKMSVIVFPVLIDVLQSCDIEKISEALDAIGFMVFYNQQLSNEKNAQAIYDVMEKHQDSSLFLWKGILCLSAFPLVKSKKILEGFISQNNLLGEEAKRSLNLINARL